MHWRVGGLLHAVAFDDQHFAGVQRADEFRLHQVEGAGFGRQHRRTGQAAQGQRAHAVRVAQGDELVVGEDDQRIRALHPLARGHDGFLEGLAVHVVRDEVHEDLAVDGGLEDGPLALQFVAQFHGVGQVAVVVE